MRKIRVSHDRKRPPRIRRFERNGFTLIEMIGVLAVIAVLVALLLPKVFEIMAESKANALVAAIRTV